MKHDTLKVQSAKKPEEVVSGKVGPDEMKDLLSFLRGVEKEHEHDKHHHRESKHSHRR